MNSRAVLYIGRTAVIFVVILKILSNYSKFTGMGRIFVCLEYDGKWKNLNGCWECVGSDLARGFMVDRSIKFLNFVETIYKKTGIQESEHTLRITHKSISERNKHSGPIHICDDDDDISDLLSLYEDQNEITIHVVLEPRKLR